MCVDLSAPQLDLTGHIAPFIAHKHVVFIACVQAVDLAGLLQPMLAWDPAERPTAAELLQHPYFKPLKEEQLQAAKAALTSSNQPPAA
jgi:serine/threonine protein kinase